MIRSILISLILIVAFISCKKDEDSLDNCEPINSLETKSTEYFPLSEGNYWVYQKFEVDSNGNSAASEFYDTLMVIGTKTLNQKQYSQIFSSTGHVLLKREAFYRDSSGYFIDEKGSIMFSAVNFESQHSHYIDTSRSNASYMSYSIDQENETAITPVGTFNTIKNVSNFIWLPSNTKILSSSHYAKGVGLISKEIKYLSPALNNLPFAEWRLVAFNVIISIDN